jgi:hypothetical protein
MDSTKRKLVSGVLTLLYVAYAYINFTASQALAIFILSLIPLGLILFAEQLGDFRGYIPRAGDIDTKTHPAILEAIGWLILLVLLIFVLMK